MCGVVGKPATGHGAKVFETKRSEGVIDVEVNGRVTFVFQEISWDEEEESMTGLICSFGGKYFAFSWESPAQIRILNSLRKSKPIMMYVERRLYVRRYVKFFQSGKRSRIRTGREHGSKLGLIWPHFVKGNGQQICAITDKPFEDAKGEMGRLGRKKDAGESKRQAGVDAAKEVEDVEKEMPRRIRRAPPTKFPPAAIGQTCSRSGNLYHLEFTRGEQLRRLGC